MKFFLFLIVISIFAQEDLEKAYLESGNKAKKNSSTKEKLKSKLTKKIEIKSDKKNSELKVYKSNWINPDFIKNTNYIPGLEKEIVKVSNSVSKDVIEKTIEVVKNPETKSDPKKQNPFYSFLSDNVKIILIISSIILFGIWRFFKPSSPERSSRVYSKFRNKN